MKFALAFLSFLTGAAASTTIEAGAEIKANSKTGRGLLSKARRLDEGDDAAEVDMSWAVDYSIKFHGCLHVSQWNENAGNDEEDVRIETKRLVRFRLCPSSSCSNESGYGCRSGYGDYIVDLNTFVETYLQHKEEMQQEVCEAAEENCNCENNGDDQYDEQACLNSCFASSGLDYCIENEDELDVNEYLQCAAYEPPEAANYYAANGYYRKTEEEEAAEYFLGPYCSNQGGTIHLGLFIDDTCTEFADEKGYGGRYTFEQISYGATMPYATKSIVDMDCYSCKVEPEYYDQYAEDEVTEFCETVYPMAGKCETELGNGNENENACNYLKGIKMTHKNGIIIASGGSSNKVVTAFIGIFACSFVLLGSYVYYLKGKVERGTINLYD